MMRKKMKQNQEKRQQRVFEKLKQKFTIKLVLVTPDLNKEIRVEVDTSDFATSRVLLIKCKVKANGLYF